MKVYIHQHIIHRNLFGLSITKCCFLYIKGKTHTQIQNKSTTDDFLFHNFCDYFWCHNGGASNSISFLAKCLGCQMLPMFAVYGLVEYQMTTCLGERVY